MQTSSLSAIRALRPAWKKGRIVGQKRPLLRINSADAKIAGKEDALPPKMRKIGHDAVSWLRPGRKGKNGVAAIQVVSDVPRVVDKATVRDAAEALSWLEAHAGTAFALGIDTLLAWSPTGGRACDNALRRKYGGNSIVAQNSLYSSMTLNGAIVAKRIGLPVYESHPKLLLRLSGANAIREVYRDALASSRADHEGDAIVAAWCAAMGHNGSWTVDLYVDLEDELELVVPGARYPWFEGL